MPRVWGDIASCVEFVARHPWGAPLLREREIHDAFCRIRLAPLSRPISGIVDESGVELRRYQVRQFEIVYAYFGPTAELPRGLLRLTQFRCRRATLPWKRRAQ